MPTGVYDTRDTSDHSGQECVLAAIFEDCKLFDFTGVVLARKEGRRRGFDNSWGLNEVVCSFLEAHGKEKGELSIQYQTLAMKFFRMSSH